MAKKRADLAERLIDCVPTNWCDSLLTGQAGIGQPPYNCDHIERLLRGVKARMEAAAALARPTQEGSQ